MKTLKVRKLKNCAHCGWGMVDCYSIKDEDKRVGHTYIVVCTVCSIQTAPFLNKQCAIKVWNRRIEK